MDNKDKEYLDKHGLDLYTREFKEWIWKLFRKVHKRIDHVEEEIANIKVQSGSAGTIDYQIEKTIEDDTEVYTLVETISGTMHGQVIVKDLSPLWNDEVTIVPMLTITVANEISNTDPITLTYSKNEYVKGDILWGCNLPEDVAIVINDELVFKDNYIGELTLELKADNVSTEKSIKVISNS